MMKQILKIQNRKEKTKKRLVLKSGVLEVVNPVECVGTCQCISGTVFDPSRDPDLVDSRIGHVRYRFYGVSLFGIGGICSSHIITQELKSFEDTWMGAEQELFPVLVVIEVVSFDSEKVIEMELLMLTEVVMSSVEVEATVGAIMSVESSSLLLLLDSSSA